MISEVFWVADCGPPGGGGGTTSGPAIAQDSYCGGKGAYTNILGREIYCVHERESEH